MPVETPQENDRLRSSDRPNVDMSAIEGLFADSQNESSEQSAPEPEISDDAQDTSVEEQVSNPVESESESPSTDEHMEDDHQQVEQTPEPQGNSLGSLLQNYGFQDIDDDSALPRLEAFMQQTQEERDRLQRLEQELEEQRRLNAAIRAHQELNAPGNSAAQPQQQQAEQDQWWNPPKVNEQTLQKYRVRNPETGMDEWAPNTPEEVRRQAEEYQLYHEEWMNKLIYDPVSIFEDMENRILSKIQPEIQQTYQQQTEAQRRESELNSMATENDWLWAVDPQTNQPLNSYSERGRAVEQTATNLIQNGLDELMAYKTAIELHKPTPVESQQRVQQEVRQEAAQKAEQRREDLLRRSRPTPSRGGSLQTTPEDSTPQDPKLSWGQQLIQQMSEA